MVEVVLQDLAGVCCSNRFNPIVSAMVELSLMPFEILVNQCWPSLTQERSIMFGLKNGLWMFLDFVF